MSRIGLPNSTPATSIALQRCMNGACRAEFPASSVLTACSHCATSGRGESLLDVVYDPSRIHASGRSDLARLLGHPANPCVAWSGVWRFRDLLPFNAAEDEEGTEKREGSAHGVGTIPQWVLQVTTPVIAGVPAEALAHDGPKNASVPYA